jgi:FAD/FMN-containing dehydrogenase
MSSLPEDALAQLRQVVGEADLILDPITLARYAIEPRKRFGVPPAGVVTPRDIPSLQAVMRWANATGIPVVPQSGNTGLVGGQVPSATGQVVVSLVHFDRIRGIEPAAATMVAETGVILELAHKAAEAHDLIFPLWLASQGSARIGGVLSSNAGGVNVLAYGNARELCLGIEAVLPDGRLYSGLSGLKKDNTGYDLKNLFIGAEGTLGIITAATLKLFPKPEDYETAIVSIASPAAALPLLSLLRQRAGGRLNAFEIVPAIGLDIQLRHGMLDRDPTPGPSPWYALVEISHFAGTEPGLLQSALEAGFEAGLVADASLAESLDDRTRMWLFREQMSECQSREGASIKHDVSVPVAAIPELIARGSAVVEKLVPGIRPVPFGHMGDGNIHFNFSQPAGQDPKTFLARWDEAVHEAIYDVVLSLGGSVSAEHGIGQIKVDLLARVKDPVALDVMKAIKRTLDPKNILNPGKVLALD